MPPSRLGPYRIEKLLGQGGMGAVYLGIHVRTDQTAAVKTLSAALSRDEDFRERFAGEIESLKKLRHPNIVQLLGWGEQDGVIFYAMEYVDGQSLQERLAGGDRMEWQEVIRISIDVCKALKHAHDSGIIHRDLKPANLLVDSEDVVKLTDFGIAKLFGHAQLTVEGGVVGTADYMAPEQALGQPVNHRCDLYGLGSLMYTLLAGRPPFLASSMPEVVHKVCYEPVKPVRRYNASVPPQLEALIGELLEKDPSRRPPTARAVTSRLEAMQHGLTELEPRRKKANEDESTEFDYGELDATITPDDARVHSATTRFAGREGDKSASADTQAGDEEKLDSGVVVTQAPLKDATTPGESGHAPGNVAERKASRRAETGDRFTTVEEEAGDAALGQRESQPSQRWIVGGLAAALAAVVALVGWQTLVPPSADKLFAAIERVAENDDAKLSDAAADIDRFLALYPSDRRAAEVRDLQEAIELDRLQTKLKLRGRRPGAAAALSPVERAYLEAVETARTRPEEAVARLQAIVDVYGGQDDAPRATASVVALARRQIDRLAAVAAAGNAAHLPQLNERLQAAAALEADDPARARAIYHGIVLLYGDAHWAADPVAQAKAALQRLATTSQ